jgi:molybdopterin/thiamine biosynthesis adenylyltransferase
MGGACSELGILGPVVGVVALNQVLDALGFLTGCKPVPWGVVRFRDFSRDEQFHLSIEPRSDCEICGFKAVRGSGDIRES